MVFFADDFLGPFQGFLITLGVPIAAWCGVFARRRAAAPRATTPSADLYDPRGRYGDVRWPPIALVVVGTVLGWGLVTNTFAGWLDWQGYLLGPLGLGGERRVGVREPRRAGSLLARLPRPPALRPRRVRSQERDGRAGTLA